MNPLQTLHGHGQAVWLDFLARRFIAEGGLKRLVQEDELTGVTSNPSIFKKAIAGSSDYDSSLGATVKDADCDVMTLYETLAIADIRNAADVLAPVYRDTKRADGFVSLEVSPYLANDTNGTIAEARRLWKQVGRENVMIKVPATEAGIPAIRQLLGEGININITLLFSRVMYRQVAQAYLDGMEKYIAGGGDATRLASVASFFVSRIDTAVDHLIDAKMKQLPAGEAETLGKLRGKIAIANAKLAYQDYKQLFAGPRWDQLKQKGARVQRLLWASTGTKNPAYSDVLYIEELIGPDTVNTVPPETLDAFRDHGKVRESLEENVEAADAALALLDRFGIALDTVTTKLIEDGVTLFAEAFDDLLAAVQNKRAAQLGSALNKLDINLPAPLDAAVKAALEDWRKGGKIRRLWQRDAGVWTGQDEAKWLGWLDIVGDERADVGRLARIADYARDTRFSHAVLLGMGGSSLGAEVFANTFGGVTSGYPKLLVLDSTDPDEIKAIEDAIDLKQTLFIVSSKSGSTLEPNILKDYFFARAEAALGAGNAGPHFIAITDPGSKMEAAARDERFRQICFGKADIGGRYSVLSDFGLVPAAIMGVDVNALLAAAATMVYSCGPNVPPAENPGVRLGAVLGTLTRQGRDKITIIASPAIADIGAWLEQLLAESTGKHGLGLVPLDGEPLGPSNVYGKDRLFVYVRLDSQPDATQDNGIAALEKAGEPVVRIALSDRIAIGQEFFRWEIATAVAGAIIGINPFDQPDVEASKIKTRTLMTAYEKGDAAAPETPLLEDGGIRVFAEGANAAALKVKATDTLVDALRAHFARLKPGDYCGLLAYVARNGRHQKMLQDIRAAVRDAKHVATCVGFGPRFLHSTGQAYKGGPNSGVFIQITASHPRDLAVPGRKYSFGAVIDATAQGDFAVLDERGRRTMRIDLGNDVEGGLARLTEAVRAALAK